MIALAGSVLAWATLGGSAVCLGASVRYALNRPTKPTPQRRRTDNPCWWDDIRVTSSRV